MKNKIEFLIATLLLFGVYFGLIPYTLYQFNETLNLPSLSHPLLVVLGIVLITIGVTVYLLTTKTFFKTAGNTPLITHPTKNVMKTSLYRKTRNPMYIGHLILIFGEFLVSGSLLILLFWVLTAISLHLLLVFYEEPLTHKQLGKPYGDYLKEVPRWF